MQKAKAAVDKFVAKAGHHDTTVHETVAPAVKHEIIKPIEHEEVVTAVDREVHQDHYHRTIQPIVDREVLPEQHEQNIAAVQHREFDHRDADTIKAKLAAEAQQFRDEREVLETKHTQSTAATVGGEHVHHHIHENIQPVVHKEIIQPSVVHTVVPIHEVHHNAATHHSTSELPPVSMTDFKAKGGALTGREERYDAFEGEPKNIGGVLGTGKTHEHSHHTGTGLTGSTGTGLTGHNTTGTGLTGHNTTGTGLTGSHDHHHTRTGLTGSKDHHHTGTGVTGLAERTGLTGSSHHNTTSGRGIDGDIPGDGYRAGNNPTSHTGITGSHNDHHTTDTKPSLLQKLNPFSDTDHDGKKGINE